jgi:hypothetical protein
MSDAQHKPVLGRRAGLILLSIALLTGAWFGSTSITDESAVSLHGDMPRHMMNGVFVRDFLADPTFSFDGAWTYAKHYFARYPALSLGHHPPLMALALVPGYAVLGVSVFAARTVSLISFLVSIGLLYLLVRRWYDERTAGWAALLFATNPFAVTYAQVVMAEMLAIALVLASFNALALFHDTDRLRYYLAFVAFAAVSLAARQVAFFVAPAYMMLLFADGGWARLRQPHVTAWSVGGAVLVALAATATLLASPFNVAVVRQVLESGAGVSAWQFIVGQLWTRQLMPSLGFAAVLALIVAVVTRDRRIAGSLAWAASVFVCVFVLTGPYEVPRYAIYGLPAYCVIAASIVGNARNRRAMVAATVVLGIVVLTQAMRASTIRPVGAGGYERAAEMVLTNGSAPTVLYSASIDSGYFVFFVRKHDPARRLIVLRSDKLLTTSFMNEVSVEDRISNREEIYDKLKTFGTRYVVIEDRPSGSRVLDWLRDECRTDRFIERGRFPIVTTDARLAGVDVVVYEYRDAQPPADDAFLDMHLPLVGRNIEIPLSELAPQQP